MHEYVIGKGTKPSLDKWAADLRAKWVPIYKDGKPQVLDGMQMYQQLSVRPVQLFEIGFPKEELENVQNILGTTKYVFKRYPILNFLAKKLRGLLKLKPVPLPTNPDPLYQPNQVHKAVAILPIGLKEDIMNEDGIEQL